MIIDPFAPFQPWVDHMPWGAALVDRRFRYRACNKTLALFNGGTYTAREHLRRPVPELYPSLWPTAGPLVKRALAGELIQMQLPPIEMPGMGEVVYNIAYGPLRWRWWTFGMWAVVARPDLMGELAEQILETRHLAQAVKHERRAIAGDPSGPAHFRGFAFDFGL